MADMKGFSEKFRVQKVNAGGDSERITVQLGLDGLKIMNADGNRTMNSYDLSHVSRWSLRGNSLILYTKTPVDVEERQITLRSDESTIRNVMDTLTCCCMQLCEILQSSGKSTSDKETANSLHQLVRGGGKKKTALPAVDEVEFWHDAEKAGYLQSQGEVMKSWRRRFFVLKQGYLLRFMDGSLNENSKPRGVVDLSKVTDVKDGKSATGKPNSLQLVTASGSVCYVADTETEMVEWMSALEGAMQQIVKHVAGVDDNSPRHPESGAQDWMKQFENNVGNSSISGSGGKATVNVIGYDSGAGSGRTGTASSGYGGSKYGGGGSYSSGIDYSNIGGIAGVVSSGNGPSRPPGGTNGGTNNSAMDDLMLNYGGAISSNSQAPSQRPYGSSSVYPTPPTYPTTTPSTTTQYPSYDSAPAYQTSTPQYPQQTDSYTSSYQQQHQQPDPYASAYQQQQQQGGHHAPVAGTAPSIIDQVPTHTPGYPYYQQPAAGAPYGNTMPQQVAAAPAYSQWEALRTADGQTYYHNSATGVTQWEVPPGM